MHQPRISHHVIGMQMAEHQHVDIAGLQPRLQKAINNTATAIKQNALAVGFDQIPRRRASRMCFRRPRSQNGQSHRYRSLRQIPVIIARIGTLDNCLVDRSTKFDRRTK